MKILLDENMPHQLRAHLPDLDVTTAVYAGFGGFKNGELLKAAEDAGYAVLLTGDLSIEYQAGGPSLRGAQSTTKMGAPGLAFETGESNSATSVPSNSLDASSRGRRRRCIPRPANRKTR